jgi:hypothetical protein
MLLWEIFPTTGSKKIERGAKRRRGLEAKARRGGEEGKS